MIPFLLGLFLILSPTNALGWGWGYRGGDFEFSHLGTGRTYSLKERFHEGAWVNCDQNTTLEFVVIKPEPTKTPRTQNKYAPIPSTDWLLIDKTNMACSGQTVLDMTINIPDDENYKGKFYWAILKVKAYSEGQLRGNHEWSIYLDVAHSSKKMLPIYQSGKAILQEAGTLKFARKYKEAIAKYADYLKFYEEQAPQIGDIPYALLPEDVLPLHSLPKPNQIESMIADCKDFTFDDYVQLLKSDRLGPDSWEKAYQQIPVSGKPFKQMLLNELGSNQDNVVRYRIIKRLGIEKSTEAIPTLTGILNNPKEPGVVRYYAAESLGDLQAKEAIPSLFTALKDTVPGVRHNAATALRKLGENVAATEGRPAKFISISRAGKWQTWLHEYFPDSSKQVTKPMLDKLPSSLGADAFRVFGDFNNDGKLDAIFAKLGEKKLLNDDGVARLSLYTWDSNRWEELFRYGNTGLQINDKSLPYFEGNDLEFTIEITVDRNGNLAFKEMVNGASDVGMLHWRPFQQRYAHDIADSGCDDY